MPAPDTAKGKVRLIGNPLKFSRTPVSYRSAPATTGADTDAVLGPLKQGL
jgi:formyl-CoA transferase